MHLCRHLALYTSKGEHFFICSCSLGMLKGVTPDHTVGGGGLSLTNMAVCVALTNWSSDAESGCVKSCIWYLEWQELLNYSVPVSNFMFIYTTCWNVLIYTPDQDEQENNLSMLHEAGCRRNSCLLHFSSNLLTNYWMEVCADAFCLLFHCQ